MDNPIRKLGIRSFDAGPKDLRVVGSRDFKLMKLASDLVIIVLLLTASFRLFFGSLLCRSFGMQTYND
jgi:hypothetical protein